MNCTNDTESTLTVPFENSVASENVHWEWGPSLIHVRCVIYVLVNVLENASRYIISRIHRRWLANNNWHWSLLQYPEWHLELTKTFLFLNFRSFIQYLLLTIIFQLCVMLVFNVNLLIMLNEEKLWNSLKPFIIIKKQKYNAICITHFQSLFLSFLYRLIEKYGRMVFLYHRQLMENKKFYQLLACVAIFSLLTQRSSTSSFVIRAKVDFSHSLNGGYP